MPPLVSSFRSVSAWIAVVVVGLLPVAFAPFTQDYYDTTKWLLLAGSAILLVCAWAVRNLITGNHHVSVSHASLGFAALAVSGIVSLIVASPNKIEALIHPLGIVTLVSLALFLIILPTMITPVLRQTLQYLVYASSGLLGLIAVYQYFGMSKILFAQIPFLQDTLWTPTGSTIATLAVFAITLPVLISDAVSSIRKRREARAALTGVIAFLILVAATLTVIQLIPIASRLMLSPADGWSIFLENVKSPNSALVGVGADNFLSAFTTGRPARLNSTDLWNARAATNATAILHVATIFGLLGALASLYIGKLLLWRQKASPAAWASRLVAAGVLFFLPPNLTILTLIMTLFLLDESHQNRVFSFRLPAAVTRLLPRLVAALALVAALGGLYGIGRAYSAETLFYRSLLAAADNKGTDTYNLEVAAIKLNPWVARFHITYSQTNLALAGSLSSSLANARETDQTAKDRQLMNALIQQAIREGKLAISLNPRDATSWQNMGKIYQNLQSVAQGADQWATTAYSQAILLDPTNPVLRVELCGAYTGQLQFDRAIAACQSAIELKPDYPNAYYNLANAQKLNGDTVAASETLITLIKMLPNGSPDWATANEQLSAIKKDTTTK